MAHLLTLCLSLMLRFVLDFTSFAQDGCGKALPPGQAVGNVTELTIISGGIERSCLLFIPPKYNITSQNYAPVIISYHGGEKTSLDQPELDQFTNPEFNEEAIVAYPQGINDTWEGTPGANADDIGFTNDLIDQLHREYCIDKKRIYATGKSDGAGFDNVLACDPLLSRRIAAFAPVSGAFYVDTLPCKPSTVTIPCNPGRDNIPMLEFHGGIDTTIRYTGGKRKGKCLPSIPHWIQEWALRDNLGLQNSTSNLSTDSFVIMFGEGEREGLVTHVFDPNIGHDWPSTVPNSDSELDGDPVASFNATPIIMKFFENHSLDLDC